jgi:hypothetical protein
LRYRLSAFFAGLLLVFSSHSTTAASAVDVRRALASPGPVVLIGVPPEFLDAASSADAEESETQSDWSYYLNLWAKSASKKIKIIVVPMRVLTEVLQLPALAGPCATLFVKNKTEGLLLAEDCVPQVDAYQAGADWLLGATRSGRTDQGMKSTVVTIRGLTK